MSSQEIQIDEALGVVVVTPAKSITVEDARTAMIEIIRSPGFKKGMPSVWDLRYTDLLHINAHDIKTLSEIANEYKDTRGEVRTAVIVNSNIGYDLGRQFEVLNTTTHINARVFRDFDEGMRWALNEDS